MRVTCLQENLSRGLSIVGRAVATRSTLPVLSNILLSAEEGRLKLVTTNLEIGVNCWIGARIDDEGSITVPARLLTEFVNSMPPGPIDMELAVRTQTLHLKAGRFEANIKGIDASDFPLVPTADTLRDTAGAVHITLAADTFRSMIDQVTFAAATDESRPILTGVLAEFESDALNLAAADGFRLSVRRETTDMGLSSPVNIIIPARALDEVSRISSGQEDPVQVIITPARNQVLFHLDSVDLVSQLIEGKFPDYDQIIPKEYATRAVVNTQDLLKAVKVSHLFARESANSVRFHVVPGTELTPGHMTITATSAELGDNVGEIDASVEGNEVEIAFNAKYMIDALSATDSAEVALTTTVPTSPGVIRPADGDDYVCVIMPMHTR
jgi:DNA polymerase-3 subunit beta